MTLVLIVYGLLAGGAIGACVADGRWLPATIIAASLAVTTIGVRRDTPDTDRRMVDHAARFGLVDSGPLGQVRPGDVAAAAEHICREAAR